MDGAVQQPESAARSPHSRIEKGQGLLCIRATVLSEFESLPLRKSYNAHGKIQKDAELKS